MTQEEVGKVVGKSHAAVANSSKASVPCRRNQEMLKEGRKINKRPCADTCYNRKIRKDKEIAEKDSCKESQCQRG